ncbi:MAG: hypothetical protein JRJ23_02010 [Deltaproteobacteria bacterium]|nr:hypothetical protein [Deltaproteobacteria bacterium]MBW1914313.1 hypothetical protein [Deltaproteobacteria bacterium]
MEENSLIHISKDDYGKDFQAHLLEQYKVVRSGITDLQNDRNTHNNFYLVILTGLVSVFGFLIKHFLSQNSQDWKLLLIFAIFPILSMVISVIWISLNNSYDKALEIRYGLLKEYENVLPSVPFTKEKDLRDNNKYIKVFDIFKCLANTFIVFNCLILIGLDVYIMWIIWSIKP